MGLLVKPHPETVRPIQKHMNHKSQGYELSLRQGKKEHIDCYGRIGVQRVKADPAAVGVVNGIRKKVIDIDDHSANHDEESPPPPIQIKLPCH